MKSPAAEGITDTVTCVGSWRMVRSSWCRGKGEGHFRWRKCPSKGTEPSRNVAFGGRRQTEIYKGSEPSKSLESHASPRDSEEASLRKKKTWPNSCLEKPLFKFKWWPGVCHNSCQERQRAGQRRQQRAEREGRWGRCRWRETERSLSRSKQEMGPEGAEQEQQRWRMTR